jgi:hypothetical protein
MLSKVKNLIMPSAVFKAIQILPRFDRPKIIAISFLQVGLGFIDLSGVAAMGVLDTLVVTGVQSQQPGL